MLHQARVISLVLCLLALWTAKVAPYGEPSPATYPSYQERTFLALLNAARVGPSAYKTNYMSGYPYSTTTALTSSSGVQPLFIDPGLSQSSRYHSVDEATNCPNSYSASSCNGQSWVTRVESYYTCSGSLYESLLYNTYTNPIDSVNQMLCSLTTSGSSYICAKDGSSAAAMRTSALSSTYTRAGAGTAVGYEWNYWTVDMGSCVPSGSTTYPSDIASGSHIISGSNTRFIAQFWNPSGTAPSSHSVVINGVSYAMTLDGGSAAKGNYYYQAASGSSCRQYYFVFVVGGVTYTYPGAGFFYTYGEGACASDYGSSGSTPTPTPTATPSASPSSSPSSSPAASPAASSTPSASPSPGASASPSPAASASPSHSPSATASKSASHSPSPSPTPTPTPTAPRAPTGLTAGTTTSSTIPLSWTAPTDNGGASITSYIISYTTGSTTSTYTSSGSGTSATLSGLTASTSYSITVAAVNSVGTGTASGSISAITASGSSSTPCLSTSCLPTSFNWRTTTGCSTGIMNQQQCGCCYSFSTAAAASDRLCYQSKINVVISPQDILDCGSGTVWSGSTACDGGDPQAAAQLQVSRGLASASSAALSAGCRPFTCAAGDSGCGNLQCTTTCADSETYNPYKGVAAKLLAQDIPTIQMEIYNNGPVTAAYDVCESFYTFFDSTPTGVYTTQCTSSSSDYDGGHSVTLIGWGVDSSNNDYWLVANSWGSSWGDNGLFRILRGTNLCGIEDYVVGTNFSSSGRDHHFVAQERDSTASKITGAAVTSTSSNPAVVDTAQLVLDTWYFNTNYKTNGRRDALPMREFRAAAPDGGFVTTGNPYTVSSISSATVQPVAGKTVGVNLVASDGSQSVSLSSTVSYGAADGSAAVSSIAASSAGGAGSSGLSTGAIVGIAVGVGGGVLLLAALAATAVAVGAVIYVKSRSGASEDVEMDDVDEPSGKKNRLSAFFTRSKRFQSITGRAPPMKTTTV